jgi:hypothetical protein
MIPRRAAPVVILVSVTAALGPYLLPIEAFGINFYTYRFLVLLLFVLSPLFAPRIRWWGSPVARFYLLLGCFWILWGWASILWAPDPSSAIRDVASVGLGFGAGLVLLNLRSFTGSGLDALRRGWLLAYVVTAAIAIWEKLTGNHLPSHFVKNAPDYVLNDVVISTFGNPNNYGAFLLLSVPFLLWSLSIVKMRLHKVFYMGLLLALPVLVFLSASRVAILGLVVQLLVCGLLTMRQWRSFVGILSIACLFFLLIGWYLQSDTLVARKLALAFGNEVRLGGSIALRRNLVLNGLWFAYISGCLGIGAGGFEHLIQNRSAPFATGHIFSPHNFWIEVLSQYGVLVFLGLVVWVLYLISVAIRSRRIFIARRHATSRVISEMILVGFVGYLFATTTSSIYIVQSTNWMFLGSMVAMGTFLRNQWVCGGAA